jgi:hypothetical protein
MPKKLFPWFLVAGLILILGGIMAYAQELNPLADRWPNTDFSQTSINLDEIISGGPRIDGIPPYYPPEYRYPDNVPFLGGETPAFSVQYESQTEADSYLPDQQQVIVVALNGEARAYPLILLNNHEIANTEIGGVPVAVTFCPLCNASIVYDRRLGEQVYHFGVSGLLRKSDMIMWDHETQSFWQQFTGEAIVGELTGQTLTQIPSVVASYGDFKAAYPDGLVLKNQSGRNPLERVSYEGYDASGTPFLYYGEIDPRLFATTRVLGYFGPTGAIAYPFETLAQVGVVNDRINGEAVVVLWQGGSVSLFTNSIETGSAALYEASLEDGRALTFAVDENFIIRDAETGSTWNVFGQATEGELTGQSLRQKFAYPHFWFAWQAFRPDTLIWEPGMMADEAWAQ